MSFTLAERSPPVTKLHSDLLWRIFNLNADMELESEDDIPAIDTLRHTSQVCSDWRDLVIGSPSLWGRVLRIASLAQDGAEWRTEVIRRTGNSSLHIKGSHSALLQVEGFVGSLLNENWSRIKSLELVFNHSPIGDESWRALFQSPAFSLETFKITCQIEISAFQDLFLFWNNAPSLRALSLINFTVDLTKGPWVSNLRHLALTSPTVPTYELLHSLLLIPFPFLESLELTDIVSSTRYIPQNSKRPLNPVSLPRLKRIELDPLYKIDIVLSILAHITPGEGCTLDFYGVNVDENTTVEIIQDVLSQYLRYSMVELAKVTKADIELAQARTSFFTTLPFGDTFYFGLACGCTTILPEHTISTILSCFAAFPFNNIRILSLKIILPLESELLNPEITQFILSLTSVEELEIHAGTLRCLDMFQKNAGVVAFPCLKNVKIRRGNASRIESFLQSRVMLGIPVDTLTLVKRSGVISEMMPLLRKFIGLTIRVLNS